MGSWQGDRSDASRGVLAGGFDLAQIQFGFTRNNAWPNSMDWAFSTMIFNRGEIAQRG